VREATTAEMVLREKLFACRDLKYKEFNSKLIPTVDPKTVIGIRTPELRKLSKEFAKTVEAAEFIKCLPHKYYEENNVHGFIIEAEKDYDAAVAKLEDFLPYIDNWATCDLISPKAFKKHLPQLLEKIKEWTKSDHIYTVRFGIGMLMRHYLDDEFKSEYLEIPAQVQSEEYYVNMMIAWYFATALGKQYDAALLYIENARLGKWTHNKAIQKAIESYRVTAEHKMYLRTLKIK